MSEIRIPLFPFSLVLFPGAKLPIHFFEPRYRAMVQHCVRERAPFGVALIKEGRPELQPGSRPAVPFSVGTLAHLDRVEEVPEGNCPQPHEGSCYNVLVRGGERFRITALDRRAAEYAVAEIELFPDEQAPPPAMAMVAQRVISLFDEYYRQIVKLMGGWQRESMPGGPVWVLDEMALVERHDRLVRERRTEAASEGGGTVPVIHAQALPEDPVVLSYVVANELRVKPNVKQDLLEIPSPLLRLQREAEILTEETANLEEQARVFLRRRTSGFGQYN
jgi:Lon protease-like protein